MSVSVRLYPPPPPPHTHTHTHTHAHQVGRSTLENTKDEQLKIDMPPTFKTTEEATDTLIAASKGLREEPDKKDNRMLLLDGARGTLCSIHCIATRWSKRYFV